MTIPANHVRPRLMRNAPRPSEADSTELACLIAAYAPHDGSLELVLKVYPQGLPPVM